MRIAVGITGASGIVYGVRLVDWLSKNNYEVHVVVSDDALLVSKFEYMEPSELLDFLSERGKVYKNGDFSSPLASSSFNIDSGVVIPCSLKTLSQVANSEQSTLISRFVGNLLRLRKKVVLVVRETPLSVLDILNMLKVSLAGAVVLPASPAFYINPENVDDLVNFVVGKVLDVLGIRHNLYRRWEGPPTRGGTRCGLPSYSGDP